MGHRAQILGGHSEHIGKHEDLLHGILDGSTIREIEIGRKALHLRRRAGDHGDLIVRPPSHCGACAGGA